MALNMPGLCPTTHQNWWLMGKKNGLNFGPFRLGLQTLTEKTAMVTATL